MNNEDNVSDLDEDLLTILENEEITDQEDIQAESLRVKNGSDKKILAHEGDMFVKDKTLEAGEKEDGEEELQRKIEVLQAKLIAKRTAKKEKELEEEEEEPLFLKRPRDNHMLNPSTGSDVKRRKLDTDTSERSIKVIHTTSMTSKDFLNRTLENKISFKSKENHVIPKASASIVSADIPVSFVEKLAQSRQKQRENYQMQKSVAKSTFKISDDGFQLSTEATKFINVKPVPDESEDVEKFSGIRLKTRLISQATLSNHMESRRFIKLSRLIHDPSIIELSKNSSTSPDWVTIGVLHSKSSPRTTAKGDKYCVAQMSSLENCGNEVNIFMFRRVFERWWKELSPGTVIAILNGKLLKKTEESSALGLQLDHPDKLLKIGTSLDYSICKAIKRDGNRCKAVINIQLGEYCEFHVTTAFKKATKGRMEVAVGSTSIVMPQSGPIFMKGGNTKEKGAKSAPGFNKSVKSSETYIFEGGGIISSSGLTTSHKPIKNAKVKAKDKEIESAKFWEYIMTQNNAGADLLLQARGIKENVNQTSTKDSVGTTPTQPPAFSINALRKIGFNPSSLNNIKKPSPADIAAKGQAIDLLKRAHDLRTSRSQAFKNAKILERLDNEESDNEIILLGPDGNILI